MIELKNLIKETKEIRQSHIDLKESCCERGGNSTVHRGVLAQYLNTSIEANIRVLLCHACNNAYCSNPKHLYWGTDSENADDAIKLGTRKSTWEYMVSKYGLDEAKKIVGDKDHSLAGKGNKGKTKSESHRKAISDSLKRKVVVAELV